jgi:hypothetical protein
MSHLENWDTLTEEEKEGIIAARKAACANLVEKRNLVRIKEKQQKRNDSRTILGNGYRIIYDLIGEHYVSFAYKRIENHFDVAFATMTPEDTFSRPAARALLADIVRAVESPDVKAEDEEERKALLSEHKYYSFDVEIPRTFSAERDFILSYHRVYAEMYPRKVGRKFLKSMKFFDNLMNIYSPLID